MRSIATCEESRPAPKRVMTAPSRRLNALTALTADDLGVLNSLKGRMVAAGEVVCKGASATDTPCFILSGWCARFSTGAGEARQIVTLLLPGDNFGLGALPWAGDSLPVCALSDAVLLDATVVRNLARLRSARHATLIEACEKASWQDQTFALNHIVRLSRQSAYQRVAHLISELSERLRVVGLIDDDRFCLPVRQKTIADILGLSGVHFNRIARQMKQDGLVDFLRGAVRVLDEAKLKQMTGPVRVD